MGKPCLSNFTKFFAIALLGTATAIAAIAVLSSPAAAKGGGGGAYDKYPWDTDNLRYGSYNAKSFNIPFHKYGGYSGVAACQTSVADGFFQTDNSVVNDFPRLVPSGRGDSVRWSVAAGSAGNNAGCDTFVAHQNRLAAQGCFECRVCAGRERQSCGRAERGSLHDGAVCFGFELRQLDS